MDLLALYAKLIAIGLEFSQGLLGPQLGTAVFTLLKTSVLIMLIVGPLLGAVAYVTLLERKVIGYMQARIGPNRVGPLGLLQPIADGVKLVFKEIIFPTGADKVPFVLAPVIALTVAMAAWAVVPFSPQVVLADVNAGLLYIMAITSMGVYGTIVAGWSSNSKYAFLGSMRAAAQIVSYEIAMGFALVCVLMVSHSLNLSDIVNGQMKGQFADIGLNFLSWNWLPLAPMLVVYFICGVAETQRAPFDMAEGESEIVGFHVEYSGMLFGVFSMGEYANMILVATLTTIMFFGGWAAPLDTPILNVIPGFVWLFGKVLCVLILFLWFRATFPRYRYDQIMRLGWKVFIPLTIVWLVLIAAWMQTPFSIWR